MRDVNMITGPKKYYEDLSEAIAQIRSLYPTACGHGSVGAWHWAVNEEVVAEAWLHARRPGWWVRIKRST
jgi:hypothetical protein